MMDMISVMLTLTTLFLAAIDDLITHKVHNVLLGVLALVCLGFAVWNPGSGGLLHALIGAAAGFSLYLPLAWFGVIGGGDLKLLAVVGLAAGITPTLIIGITAFGWGVLIGLLQVIVRRQFKSFLNNLRSMSRMIVPDDKSLHRIPYALALFLAGLTHYFVLEKIGGWI